MKYMLNHIYCVVLELSLLHSYCASIWSTILLFSYLKVLSIQGTWRFYIFWPSCEKDYIGLLPRVWPRALFPGKKVVWMSLRSNTFLPRTRGTQVVFHVITYLPLACCYLGWLITHWYAKLLCHQQIKNLSTAYSF